MTEFFFKNKIPFFHSFSPLKLKLLAIAAVASPESSRPPPGPWRLFCLGKGAGRGRLRAFFST